MAEGFFERAFSDAGRSLDRGVDQAEQVTKETKSFLSELQKSVTEGVQQAINKGKETVRRTADQATQALKNGRDAIVSGYRNVSEGAKKGVETVVNGATALLNKGKEYTQNKIEEFTAASKMIAEAVKNGTLNSIKYAKETGRMIVVIAGKSFEYAVTTGKQQINSLIALAKTKTIQAVKYAAKTGEMILTTAKETLKISLQVAIVVGIVLYRGGKMVVNGAVLAVNKAGKAVQEGVNYAGKKASEGVAYARAAAADGLRGAANMVDPRMNDLLTQK